MYSDGDPFLPELRMRSWNIYDPLRGDLLVCFKKSKHGSDDILPMRDVVVQDVRPVQEYVTVVFNPTERIALSMG